MPSRKWAQPQNLSEKAKDRQTLDAHQLTSREPWPSGPAELLTHHLGSAATPAFPAWPGDSHILARMASRASVTGCRLPLGPVHPAGFWSASPETSSPGSITEVRHPENLLTEPFSPNCKQIGGFECYATRLQRAGASESCWRVSAPGGVHTSPLPVPELSLSGMATRSIYFFN